METVVVVDFVVVGVVVGVVDVVVVNVVDVVVEALESTENFGL